MDRRQFLRFGTLFCGAAIAPWSLFAKSAVAESAPTSKLSTKVIAELEKSPYVYISPLKSNGQESRCHGEVWYAWIDGAVVATVGTDRWKAKALARGLDSAKIWVGDYGRSTFLGAARTDYLQGPSFVARAQKSQDADLMSRLLAAYAKKYPAEIAKWRDKMQKGFEDGSRTLVRYTPISAS